MKKLITFLLIAVCSLSCAIADETQWEYMVISTEGEFSTEYSSHTIAYFDEGLGYYLEASNIEKDLNILGRHGWELVNIIGNTKENQQLTLKRPYDEERSNAEKKKADELLKKLDEKYQEQLKNQSTEKTSYEFKNELKELDSFEEKEKARLQLEEKTDSLKKAINKSLKGSELKILKEKYKYDSKKIEITLDVLIPQRFLINGDSYRLSEIEKYAKIIKPLFELKEFESENNTFIFVNFYLEKDGAYQAAGGQTYFFDQYFKEWFAY